MTQGNNNMETQLNRLLAEMDAYRRRLQSEISARQKAEKDLRDFAASRNIKILQATEEALRSAWEEMEAQRAVVKEQQIRIRFLESQLAEWEAAEPAYRELVPDAPEDEPLAMDEELLELVPDVLQADAAITADSGAGSRPWYLDQQVFSWLASTPLIPAADTAMPGYFWHQTGPEMESSVRVSFRGRSLSLSVLKRFIDEEPGICVLILRDVNEERLEEAEKEARRLRLAAREIGAIELEKSAGEVEALLMQGEERIFVVRQVVEMENAMRALLEEIIALLETGTSENIAAETGSGTEENTAVLLRRLGRLLADGSEEIRAFLDEHRSALSALLDPDEWDDFLQYVQEARYEQAMQMIEYYL